MNICFASCSLKIYSDFDHDISFANYKTYGWSNKDASKIKTNPHYHSDLIEKLIKREVDLQLKNKGYVFSELHPDLVMNYHFILESWTTAITPDPFDYLYDSYWLNRTVHLNEDRVGTLIIDLMDPKTDLLVWRGWVINFKRGKNPNKIESQIKTAAHMIFKKIPVLRN